VSGGGAQTDGSADSVTYRWTIEGSKTVSVRSAGREALCTVIVGTGASEVASAFTAAKAARNQDIGQQGFHDTADISDGQTVEFQIAIKNTTNGSLGSLSVRDTAPSGMSYVANSTFVDGVTVADGITSGGISVPVGPSALVVVRWSANADHMGALPAGVHQESPEAVVRTADGRSRSVSIPVTLHGTGTGYAAPSGPDYAAIPTGPSDTLIIALIAAAAAALLYAGYTRSDIFRRREAEQLGEDQGPLDFRG
jgi:uncharacterized repeat protein (TIGR01451 family)